MFVKNVYNKRASDKESAIPSMINDSDSDKLSYSQPSPSGKPKKGVMEQNHIKYVAN
jgi:hypothetical protein